MLRVRGPGGRLSCWAPCGQRRAKTSPGPKRDRGPQLRTPWTVRGPPPGAKLPWYLQDVPPVREQVPELDVVTYKEKLYRVPWLAKPRFEKWERGWHDRRHDGPCLDGLPSYKERPCYVCQQKTRLLEGTGGQGGGGGGGSRAGGRGALSRAGSGSAAALQGCARACFQRGLAILCLLHLNPAIPPGRARDSPGLRLNPNNNAAR